MAKDNRIIKSNIRLNGKSYGPGQEDEAAALISPLDGARLFEAEALEGEWEFKGGVKEKEKSEPFVIPDELKAFESLGPDVVSALVKGGYDTLEKIGVANDEALEKLPKVSKATVTKIRQLSNPS